MKRRGIIHVHSCYSYDSVTALRSFLRVAEAEALDFVILTDHGTVEGSRALRRLVRGRGLPIEIPLAAEYKTDVGDVIAMFIEREVETVSFDRLVKEVKSQGGVLLLPHPYHNHSDVERIGEAVDLIEVYNARLDRERNDLATRLSQRLLKPPSYGSDAHLGRHVASVVAEVYGGTDLRTSLLSGGAHPAVLRPVSRQDVLLSQYVKATKTGDVSMMISLTFGRALRCAHRLVASMGHFEH